MDEITPEVLRVLYMKELLTDGEIAERFGTYQVKISRLRASFGIDTLTKAERARAALPSPTPRQHDILIGSLLGDGWMNATGPESARFGESHAVAQEAYLRWKAQEMEPYTSSVFKTVKRERGREHRGFGMSTRSCPQLRPFYEMFYVHGKRRFPANLPECMTALALAVWYMDDGSVTVTGSPRIAFGLGVTSLQRGVKALRRLGLRPRVYGEGSERGIHFPKQEREFLEIVKPHVIPEMAYKLPRDTPRRKIDRNARKLTPERAATLYEAGMTKEQIASAFGVGSSTVGRRLVAAGTRMRKSGPCRATWTPDAARDALAGYDPVRWKALGDDERERWVTDIGGILRFSGFPHPERPSASDAREELGRLREVNLRDEGGEIQPRSMRGMQLCNAHFPNRYRASWRGRQTSFEAWHDDAKLAKAVRFQLDHGDPVTPARVLRALTMQYRTPTIFRPAVARFVYERYAEPGQVVWDPCAGYGGRLLGAMAAGVRYVGTDVEPETVEGNRRLASLLGMAASVEMHRERAEAFRVPPVSLVFTSPPYMDVERYSDSEQQSWRLHGGDWVEGFLRPVIRAARGALKDGCMVLNVADIRNRGVTYPLVQVASSVASSEGFTLLETLRMPLSALNRKKPWEPLLVFR